MVLHRQPLSRATIIVFHLLVMTVVVCQGQIGEILNFMKNQTVFLREEANFFCQIRGASPTLRINGIQYYPKPLRLPNSSINATVNVAIHKQGGEDEFNDYNISVTITALAEYNETVLECYDGESISKTKSTATLIIRGAPAKPEVHHQLHLKQNMKEILLSWVRPFTWEEYSITSYHVVCEYNDLEVYDKIITNNTENRDIITETVNLNQSFPECYVLQCNVTASNALDESTPDVVNISIPTPIRGRPNITMEKKPLFTEDQKPQITFCVKLPVLCRFQTVKYTITFFHEGRQVLLLSKEFSYRNGYNGGCVNVTVTDGLEDGKEYNVMIFVDGGNRVGNSSSTTLIFKPVLLGAMPPPDDPNFYETDTGIIVIIAVVSALVLLLLVLITIIALSYRKKVQSRSGTTAPIKRTITPMVNNPIYNDSGSPVVYEQVRPIQLSRFNSTVSSHSNLDHGINHAPSPTHSFGNRTPMDPYHINNQPRSPGSTGSSTAFIWPYSTIQQANAATFDAIEASVANETGQTNVPLPHSTPADDSYMTMHSVVKPKNINLENDLSRPRHAIDIHGNQYIEC